MQGAGDRNKVADKLQHKTLPPSSCPLPPEVGGRGGPDPVRYGDWEIKGKAVDF